MNKITPKNLLTERSALLTKQWFLTRKYSTKDEDKDAPEKDQRLNREKASSPKGESIQEEKYFHKEEVEQLKELKKKLKKKKPKADDSQ